MKKDNPVVVFGALAAVVFLIIAGWLFLPWFREPAPVRPEMERTVAPDTLPCFFVLSDIHLHSSLVQSDIPNRASDTGHDLWDTAQRKIASVLAGSEGFTKPKFIVVLGDLPWHAWASNAQDLESAHQNSGTVLHDLRTLAQNAGVPLIYVSGNNDPWDGDYHPFSTKIFLQDTGCKNCWPYYAPRLNDGTISETESIDTSELYLGCYASHPLGRKEKLKVVVLNSTMFVNNYEDVKGNQQKYTTEQLNWLARQLESASADSEHVLLVMHVPVGEDGYKKKDFWNKELTFNGTTAQNSLLDTIERYQGNIIGILSSHTHMDGVRKLYGHSGKLIAIDISAPGIAPGHGNNPGFKLISYNKGDLALQNFTTFYEDYFASSKVISWGTSKYDFRTEFGCPAGTSMRGFLDTLNPATLQNAVQSIYTVKNGKGKADEVKATLEVRYE